MIRHVKWTKIVDKQLDKLPEHIGRKFQSWVSAVELVGLEEVRKRPSFHDEPLKGSRAGQRSIRLSIGWRAIYEIHDDGSVQFVQVEEVTHHGY